MHTRESELKLPKELKTHIDFIEQESKGYTVQLFDKETKKSEAAIVRLIEPTDRSITSRIVYTKEDKRITGHEFVQESDIKQEYLHYELVKDGNRLGTATFLLNKQYSKFSIHDLSGSNGGRIGNIGLNLIRIGIQLKQKKKFEGEIYVDSVKNSPGFYWLAGFSTNTRNIPPFEKEMVKRATQKLQSLEDEKLANDEDVLQAKWMLATKTLYPSAKHASRKEDAKKYSEEKISMTVLRLQWPKLIRDRSLYESIRDNELVMDELALARLQLPRFKIINRDNLARPDTTDFVGNWKLSPMSLDEWENHIQNRRSQLEEHMEKIKKEVILSEKMFLLGEAAEEEKNNIESKESNISIIKNPWDRNVPIISIVITNQKIKHAWSGYELCLMSDDIKPEPCKLYLRVKTNHIAYTTILPNNEFARDIEITTLPVPEPFTLNNLNNIKEQILEITTKAGHTPWHHLSKRIAFSHFAYVKLKNKETALNMLHFDQSLPDVNPEKAYEIIFEDSRSEEKSVFKLPYEMNSNLFHFLTGGRRKNDNCMDFVNALFFGCGAIEINHLSISTHLSTVNNEDKNLDVGQAIAIGNGVSFNFKPNHFAIYIGNGLFISAPGPNPLAIMTLEEMKLMYDATYARPITPLLTNPRQRITAGPGP